MIPAGWIPSQKLIFFGTSHFAATILSFLHAHKAPIAAVITRPDQPQGRSSRPSAPPVKERALSLNIPLHQPQRASSLEFEAILKQYHAALFVVVAYGEILKQNILDIPSLGCINVHASLLPHYRGAAPMQRALMDGVSETGITIIRMTLKMDAGEMLEVRKLPVSLQMNLGELQERLIVLSSEALLATLHAFSEGSVHPIPQDESRVTFAPKILPEEEEIHWDLPAEQLHNLIRALSPQPGAWSTVLLGDQKKRLKIKKSIVVKGLFGQPAATLALRPKEWIVACGTGALQLLEVQLEGKKNLPVEAFLNGLHEPIKFL